MQPEQNNVEQPIQQAVTPDTPGTTAGVSVVGQIAPGGKPPKKSTRLAILSVVLLLIIGASVYWFFLRDKNELPASNSAQESSQSEDIEEAADLSTKLMTGAKATDMVWSEVTAGSKWRDISSETGVQQFMLIGTRCSVTFEQPSGVLSSGHDTNEVVAKANLERTMNSIGATSSSGTTRELELKEYDVLYNDSITGYMGFAGARFDSNDGLTMIEVYALVSGDYALIATTACGGGDYKLHTAEINKMIELPKAHIAI